MKIFKSDNFKEIILVEIMSLEEKKEKLSVKIDERKVKHEERKAQAKVKAVSKIVMMQL